MSVYDAALDEFIRRAESGVEPCADTLREDHPRVDGYVDFGIPLDSGAAQTSDGLSEASEWCEQPRQVEGTGVLLDNTTIVTLVSLLQGDRLSPLTLWDLGRAVTALITYDNIFHFENPDVNDDELNAKIGEVAFRSLNLPSEGPQYDPRGIRGIFNTAWSDTHSIMQRLEHRVGTPTMEGFEIDALAKQWSLALDFPLEPTDVVNAEMSAYKWRSPGATLLRQLWEATSTHMPVFDSQVRMLRLEEKRYPDLAEAEFQSLRWAIRQSNYRGHVNQRLAGHLSLPYMPNVARIPFRYYFYDRARAVSDRLPSVLALDTRYAERAAQAQLLSGEPFVLPVFLALVVRDAATPQDLWAAVAKLRRQAQHYRERRVDLDKALEQGNLDVTAATLKAVRTEAERLTALLGDAGGAAADSVINSVAAKPVTLLSGMPLDWLQAGITALIAGMRKLLPESVTHRLVWRLCRPEFRFLSDVASQSRAITTAMPAIQRLWDLPDGQIEAFRRRYNRFASFQTTRDEGQTGSEQSS